MINTVRTRTLKPARAFFAAIERYEEKPQAPKEVEPRRGFFEGFFKMWENQANLVVRNLND